MRITYKTLLGLLSKMDESQLNCDVMVEYYDGETMCCPAYLLLADIEHPLGENHPVIYCNTVSFNDTPMDNVDEIAKIIAL